MAEMKESTYISAVRKALAPPRDRTHESLYDFACEVAAGAVGILERLERYEKLEAIVDRLGDDDLADKAGKDCHDPDHSDNWCLSCDARHDGIEAYRLALLKRRT